MLTRLLARAWLAAATIPVLALAGLALLGVRLLGLFRGSGTRDPFHDSRRHPLNSPAASRG